MLTRDLTWAAGFLEGEGSFRYNVASPLIQAAQAQLAPLERLQRLFGGRIHPGKQYKPHHKPIWLWAIGGTNAAALMMTLFVEMSPRRREQITAALAPWRVRDTLAWRGAMTHCKRGHAFTPDNVFSFGPGNKWRACRECRRNEHRERSRRQRHAMQYCKRGHEMVSTNVTRIGPQKKYRACVQCHENKRTMQSFRRRMATRVA